MCHQPLLSATAGKYNSAKAVRTMSKASVRGEPQYPTEWVLSELCATVQTYDSCSPQALAFFLSSSFVLGCAPEK